MNQPFMSGLAIAKAIPLSYSSVLAKIHRGELNSIQMAGNYAVPTDEAMKFIAKEKKLLRCTPEYVEQLEARIQELEGAVVK